MPAFRSRTDFTIELLSIETNDIMVRGEEYRLWWYLWSGRDKGESGGLLTPYLVISCLIPIDYPRDDDVEFALRKEFQMPKRAAEEVILSSSNQFYKTTHFRRSARVSKHIDSR